MIMEKPNQQSSFTSNHSERSDESVEKDLPTVSQTREPSCPFNRDKKNPQTETNAESCQFSRASSTEHLVGIQVDSLVEETLDLFGKYLISILRQLPTSNSYPLQQRFINEAIDAKLLYESQLPREPPRPSGYQPAKRTEDATTPQESTVKASSTTVVVSSADTPVTSCRYQPAKRTEDATTPQKSTVKASSTTIVVSNADTPETSCREELISQMDSKVEPPDEMETPDKTSYSAIDVCQPAKRPEDATTPQESTVKPSSTTIVVSSADTPETSCRGELISQMDSKIEPPDEMETPDKTSYSAIDVVDEDFSYIKAEDGLLEEEEWDVDNLFEMVNCDTAKKPDHQRKEEENEDKVVTSVGRLYSRNVGQNKRKPGSVLSSRKQLKKHFQTKHLGCIPSNKFDPPVKEKVLRKLLHLETTTDKSPNFPQNASEKHELASIKLKSLCGKRLRRTSCWICSGAGKKKPTGYVCAQCPCLPALCGIECFNKWHSK